MRCKPFFKEIKACMSTKTRTPSYYDTLNVPQNSTQEDIKSAYYELTKQYHPDRNTSEEAKLKFQKVSDAYEVLGNYEKRKFYDRNLAARGSKAMHKTVQSHKEDELAKFYRSRMKNPEISFHTYNFDAWTKAHYSRSFDRSMLNKNSKILREEMRRYLEEENESIQFNNRIIIVLTLIIFILTMIQMYKSAQYDEPKALKKK